MWERRSRDANPLPLIILGYAHTTEWAYADACDCAGSADNNNVDNRRLRRHGLHVGPIWTALAAPPLQYCHHFAKAMTQLSMYINQKNEMICTRGRPLNLLYNHSIAKITAAYLQVLLSKHRSLSRHGETLVTPEEPIDKRRAEDEKEDRSRIVHVFFRDRQVWRER